MIYKFSCVSNMDKFKKKKGWNVLKVSTKVIKESRCYGYPVTKVKQMVNGHGNIIDFLLVKIEKIQR